MSKTKVKSLPKQQELLDQVYAEVEIYNSEIDELYDDGFIARWDKKHCDAGSHDMKDDVPTDIEKLNKGEE